MLKLEIGSLVVLSHLRSCALGSRSLSLLVEVEPDCAHKADSHRPQAVLDQAVVQGHREDDRRELHDDDDRTSTVG